MIKRPSIAAHIFNDHFCSIHRTFSNTAQPGSNVHVDRLKTANHSKLQNKNFKIPFVTCAFVEKTVDKTRYILQRPLDPMEVATHS